MSTIKDMSVEEKKENGPLFHKTKAVIENILNNKTQITVDELESLFENEENLFSAYEYCEFHYRVCNHPIFFALWIPANALPNTYRI